MSLSRFSVGDVVRSMQSVYFHCAQSVGYRTWQSFGIASSKMRLQGSAIWWRGQLVLSRSD